MRRVVASARSKRHKTVAIFLSSIVVLGLVNVSYYAERLLPVISTYEVMSSIMSDKSGIIRQRGSNNHKDKTTVKATKQKVNRSMRGTVHAKSESRRQAPDKKQFTANHHLNPILERKNGKNTIYNIRNKVVKMKQAPNTKQFNPTLERKNRKNTSFIARNDVHKGVKTLKRKNTTMLLEMSNRVKDTTSTTTTTKLDDESPLNDKTIPWPDKLSLSTKQPRSAQVLLTNYGWNHPNQTIGLTHARSIRSTGLLKGIIKHPSFNSVSWDIVSSQPTNMTTYVFLDIEMCFEMNWPHYGGHTGPNVDTVQNRSTEFDRDGCCYVPLEVLRQPIFSSPNVILVLFDCSGTGMRYCCLNIRDTTKTSVVSISATTVMQSKYDLGLPPPAMNLVDLTRKDTHDLITCKEESRPLLYTFAGAFGRGNLRDKLRPLHNGRDVFIVDNTRDLKLPYNQFLLKSKFAATPKGDDLFSYRFTEVMSAGAIPVVHADDWALPFSSRLIDWNKCAVIIPEARVNETVAILSNISKEERCEKHKCVLNAYHRFMKTPEQTIVGIINSLEPLMNTTRTEQDQSY